MAIRFYCPLGHRLHAPESQQGKLVHCPACRQRVIVPSLKGGLGPWAEPWESAGGEDSCLGRQAAQPFSHSEEELFAGVLEEAVQTQGEELGQRSLPSQGASGSASGARQPEFSSSVGEASGSSGEPRHQKFSRSEPRQPELFSSSVAEGSGFSREPRHWEPQLSLEPIGTPSDSRGEPRQSEFSRLGQGTSVSRPEPIRQGPSEDSTGSSFSGSLAEAGKPSRGKTAKWRPTCPVDLDPVRRREIGWLALGLGAIVLFSMGPALRHVVLSLAPGWARGVVLAGLCQLAYLVWMRLTVHRTALWMVMAVFGAGAVLSATATAFLLVASPGRPLAGGLQEIRSWGASWFGCVLSMQTLGAYLAGRVAFVWGQQDAKLARYGPAG